MLKVALTGNIASGKSTVVEVWRSHGVRVIESDELAREAVQPGTEALDRIVRRWGPGILLPSGELDRAALRDVVFRDPEERRHLESIVHPAIERLRQEELRRARDAGLQLVVSDVPLLFEAGIEDEFDLIVLVDAPDEVRLERLVELRQLDPAEAARMIAAQWPSQSKRHRADLVIDNHRSLDDLERRANDVLTALLERADSGGPE